MYLWVEAVVLGNSVHPQTSPPIQVPPWTFSPTHYPTPPHPNKIIKTFLVWGNVWGGDVLGGDLSRGKMSLREKKYANRGYLAIKLWKSVLSIAFITHFYFRVIFYWPSGSEFYAKAHQYYFAWDCLWLTVTCSSRSGIFSFLLLPLCIFTFHPIQR